MQRGQQNHRTKQEKKSSSREKKAPECEPPPSKKVCTVTKKYPLSNDFIYCCGDVQFDNCPICLKFNPKELNTSCQSCSTYICRICSERAKSRKCPVCKCHSLMSVSFKEKKFLENVDCVCPKCNSVIKFSNNFSIMSHKIQCFLDGWEMIKGAGESNEFEDLVECLLKNKEDLIKLPDGFEAFTEKIAKTTDVDWNISYGKYIRTASDQILAIKKKGEVLAFTLVKPSFKKSDKIRPIGLLNSSDEDYDSSASDYIDPRFRALEEFSDFEDALNDSEDIEMND